MFNFLSIFLLVLLLSVSCAADGADFKGLRGLNLGDDPRLKLEKNETEKKSLFLGKREAPSMSNRVLGNYCFISHLNISILFIPILTSLS